MSARSLNKVLLIGNLTRDPELRYTPSGTAVCTFGLATNRSWASNEGGERQEETEFHRIVAWAKLGEICSQLLFKGRKVYVEGRLQTRKWTGQDGNERETTEVVIDNMIALGAPKNAQNEESYSEYDYATDTSYQTGTGVASASSAVQTQSDDSQGDDEEKPDQKQKPKAAAKKEEVDVDDIPF